MKKFKALAAILVSILFITGNIFAQNACGIQATPTTPVGCFGSATGSIDLQLANPGVSGGYTYQWSNGATTQDLTNIPAGTYTVLITYLWNGQGCQSQSNPITVNQPQFGLSLNTSAFPVSCFGLSDGWTELVILGGTAPYETHWSNGANTEDLDNVPAGTYFVTVTDANGCVNTGAVTVGQPAPLQVSTSVQQGSCGQFGSIDVSVSGGTAGYTYDWSNDGPESPDNDPQDLSGLTTGTYTVTITDAHGCPVTTSATITGGGQGINPNVTSTCDGAIISGLTAGTYTVTITNSDGCTKTATFTVSGGSMQTWFQDNDHDNFGNQSVSIQSCVQPSGYVLQGGDCNDANATVYPSAPELCDGLDNNCDGITPNNEFDNDADGFTGCQGDCNDWNSTIFPGAQELADNLDNDCDGLTDEGIVLPYYVFSTNSAPCCPQVLGSNTATVCQQQSPFTLTAVGGGPNIANYKWPQIGGGTFNHTVEVNPGLGVSTYLCQIKTPDGVWHDVLFTLNVVNCLSGTNEDRGPGEAIKAYPNPTRGQVNFEGLTPGMKVVQILNELGQTEAVQKMIVNEQ